jgi:hypothetical protein
MTSERDPHVRIVAGLGVVAAVGMISSGRTEGIWIVGSRPFCLATDGTGFASLFEGGTDADGTVLEAFPVMPLVSSCVTLGLTEGATDVATDGDVATEGACVVDVGAVLVAGDTDGSVSQC